MPHGTHRREANEAWMSRGRALVNRNEPMSQRTNIKEKKIEKVQPSSNEKRRTEVQNERPASRKRTVEGKLRHADV